MKTWKKLFVCLLLAISFVLPSFFVQTETRSVAANGTGYTEASDVKYVKSGKYVANWGAREEECVFLTTYAQDFYTGNYAYDTMSQLVGSSSESGVPKSALYKSLQTLMKTKQTSQTSYDGTKSLFRYTDCLQGNSSKISSFYSGQMLSGSWDGSWNREHTWPNSKGDASGSGENDIMMLRPTSTSENSSRGNKAYGESSKSYYDPNELGQELRGDCARIVLYVYVRWGCTNTGSGYNPTGIFGTKGVIESLTLLLRWMEEDPVDTWEMGRNDAVQSITGTRNVFVDYPEYAWLLFGQEIPNDMTTPSGIAKGGSTNSSSSSSSSSSSINSSVDSSADSSIGGGEAVNVTKTTLTSANLGLTDSYNTAEKFATVDGITYAILSIGDWGSGIQCNKKTVSSAIRNSTPFGTSIRKIVFTPTAGKATSGKAWKAYFGNTEACNELTLDVSTDANGFITVNVPGDYTYFKLEHANGNAQYFSSIEIFCEESGEVTPPVDSSVVDSSEEVSSSQEESSSIIDSSEEVSSPKEESSSIIDSSEEVSSSVEESSSVENSSEEINSSIEENSCQHEYGRWFVIKKPTETEEGERERFCQLCGQSQKESIPVVIPESSSVEASSEEVGSSVEESSSMEDTSEENSSSVETSSESVDSTVESSAEEHNSAVESSPAASEQSPTAFGCSSSVGATMGGVFVLLTSCAFVYKRKKKE